MAYVFVEHKIGEWSDFEGIFRSDASRRRKLGSKGGRVFRNPDDPSDVFVVFEWADLDGAREFAAGLEAHEAAEWATSGIWSIVRVVEEVVTVDA
jgi:heme-degrading monooxygenase HmoA